MTPMKSKIEKLEKALRSQWLPYSIAREVYVAYKLVPSYEDFVKAHQSELELILKRRPTAVPKIIINVTSNKDNSSLRSNESDSSCEKSVSNCDVENMITSNAKKEKIISRSAKTICNDYRKTYKGLPTNLKDVYQRSKIEHCFVSLVEIGEDKYRKLQENNYLKLIPTVGSHKNVSETERTDDKNEEMDTISIPQIQPTSEITQPQEISQQPELVVVIEKTIGHVYSDVNLPLNIKRSKKRKSHDSTNSKQNEDQQSHPETCIEKSKLTTNSVKTIFNDYRKTYRGLSTHLKYVYRRSKIEHCVVSLAKIGEDKYRKLSPTVGSHKNGPETERIEDKNEEMDTSIPQIQPTSKISQQPELVVLIEKTIGHVYSDVKEDQGSKLKTPILDKNRISSSELTSNESKKSKSSEERKSRSSENSKRVAKKATLEEVNIERKSANPVPKLKNIKDKRINRKSFSEESKSNSHDSISETHISQTARKSKDKISSDVNLSLNTKSSKKRKSHETTNEDHRKSRDERRKATNSKDSEIEPKKKKPRLSLNQQKM